MSEPIAEIQRINHLITLSDLCTEAKAAEIMHAFEPELMALTVGIRFAVSGQAHAVKLDAAQMGEADEIAITIADRIFNRLAAVNDRFGEAEQRTSEAAPRTGQADQDEAPDMFPAFIFWDEEAGAYAVAVEEPEPQPQQMDDQTWQCFRQWQKQHRDEIPPLTAAERRSR